MPVTSASLPTGDNLAPGETILRAGEFSRNNLAFWAKVRLAATNRRVAGTEPALFLGLIPVGGAKRTYPLPNIAGTEVKSRIWVGGLIFTVIFMFLGIFLLADGGLGLLLIIVAVVLGISSFYAEISISNTGGQSIAHRIAYYERGAAGEFTQALNGILTSLSTQPADRYASSSGAPVAQPIASASAADSLAQLARMRDNGLVTEDEYNSKRQEILRRL